MFQNFGDRLRVATAPHLTAVQPFVRLAQ
jgi:hypothetical protein